jgi:hypothetical protein
MFGAICILWEEVLTIHVCPGLCWLPSSVVVNYLLPTSRLTGGGVRARPPDKGNHFPHNEQVNFPVRGWIGEKALLCAAF